MNERTQEIKTAASQKCAENHHTHWDGGRRGERAVERERESDGKRMEDTGKSFSAPSPYKY